MCMYVYIYIRMCVCFVCVCIYIYMHAHAHPSIYHLERDPAARLSSPAGTTLWSACVVVVWGHHPSKPGGGVPSLVTSQ